MRNGKPTGSNMKATVEITSYIGSKVRQVFSSGENSIVNGAGIRASFNVDRDGSHAIQAEADEEVENASIDLVLTLKEWSGGYVLVPGAVYDGNRFRVLDKPYPPIYDCEDPSYTAPVLTDLPRMPSFHFLAGDATYPAVGLWDQRTCMAHVVLFPVDSSLGPVGFRVQEDSMGLSLRIQFPGVRSEGRYAEFKRNCACEDKGARFLAGASFRGNISVQSIPVSSVVDLFRAMDERRHLRVSPTVPHHLRPFASAAELIVDDMRSRKWRSTRDFFETADGSWGTIDFQVGWVGGGMETLPLVELADLEMASRARKNIDQITSKLQAESGYFHGGVRDVVCGDGFGHDHAEHWGMVRKSGDMLLFLLRHILCEPDPPAQWLASARKCADAFVRTRSVCGQIGQFLDVRDGRVVVGGSTCGGTAIAALAIASRQFGDERYLRTSIDIANDYVASLRQGILNGGPGEILKAPDSESAFGLLEGYIVLWETTGADRWLELAEEAAYQAASWVVPYDFPFPPTSSFGELGMQSAGTVIANVQNKHSAPGICTASALPLLKLFRATGRKRWLDLAVEISHALPQFVSSCDRPIRADDGRCLPSGWVNERVNMSDWEAPSRGPGEVFYGPCWSATSVLLTELEMPGVYVRRDLEIVACADHVTAELSGDKLFIRNPTRYPARVLPLIDRNPSLPLGELWWRGAKRVDIAPWQTASLTID
jgi:hypothetical protein